MAFRPQKEPKGGVLGRRQAADEVEGAHEPQAQAWLRRSVSKAERRLVVFVQTSHHGLREPRSKALLVPQPTNINQPTSLKLPPYIYKLF